MSQREQAAYCQVHVLFSLWLYIVQEKHPNPGSVGKALSSRPCNPRALTKVYWQKPIIGAFRLGTNVVQAIGPCLACPVWAISTAEMDELRQLMDT